MVEVHLVTSEAATTVRAGNLTKLTQERGCGNLSAPHALDFPRPIARVIPHIGGALIAGFGHSQV
jgi:hypothetical protein